MYDPYARVLLCAVLGWIYVDICVHIHRKMPNASQVPSVPDICWAVEVVRCRNGEPQSHATAPYALIICDPISEPFDPKLLPGAPPPDPPLDPPRDPLLDIAAISSRNPDASVA